MATGKKPKSGTAKRKKPSSKWRSKKQNGKIVRFKVEPKKPSATSVPKQTAKAKEPSILKEYRYDANSTVYACKNGHIARSSQEVKSNRCGYRYENGKVCGAQFKLVDEYIVRKRKSKDGHIYWTCTCPAYRYSSKCKCGHELRYHRHKKGKKSEIGYCSQCGYMKCRNFEPSGEKTCKHIEDAKGK